MSSTLLALTSPMLTSGFMLSSYASSTSSVQRQLKSICSSFSLSREFHTRPLRYSSSYCSNSIPSHSCLLCSSRSIKSFPVMSAMANNTRSLFLRQYHRSSSSFNSADAAVTTSSTDSSTTLRDTYNVPNPLPTPDTPAPASIQIPFNHQQLFDFGVLPTPDSLENPSSRVKKVFEDLMNLSTFEAMQLSEVLQVKHRIIHKCYGVGISIAPTIANIASNAGSSSASPTSAKPATAATPAATPAAAPAAAQLVFSIRLDSFGAADKIKVIKEVRAATGLGLKESKELVESAPKVIKKDMNKVDAETLAAKLKEVGAKVTIE